MRYLLIAFISLLSLGSLRSQESANQQKIVENGKTYLVYKVQAGETLYAISKKYRIDIRELRSCNPQLTAGLKSGDVLRIPSLEESSPVMVKDGSDHSKSYIEHKVQKKETLYYISRKYGIPVSEILAFNPGLGQLKKGEVILIPQGSRQATGSSGKSVSSAISHTIMTGETLYSVSKKYNVSAEQILALNPSLKTGFNTGNVIQIPVSDRDSNEKKPLGREPIRHVVTKGETLFGMSQNYQVPMTEIIKNNPFLENRSIRIGDTLLIVTDSGKLEKEENKSGLELGDPVRLDESNNRITGGCNPENRFRKEGKSIRIAMLLPLMIEQNQNFNSDFLSSGTQGNGVLVGDSSTVVQAKVNRIEFQGNSENYLHFYEGVLLAIDSLQHSGIKVVLDVHDTEQKTSRIRYLANSGALEHADLIIGPVYPNELKEISDYVRKKKIPLVSPLSSSDDITLNNPFFIQVNPTREYLSQKTVEYIASRYKTANILVVQTSNSENVAEEEQVKLRQEFVKTGDSDYVPEIKLCNFRKEGYAGLKQMLSKERKNILVIPSSSEAEVNVVVTSIKTLVAEYDITLIGSNRFPQFESIDPEFFHLGNLEFLTPYWPDYSQYTARSFVYKFRNYFRAEPNQFSMQGYDVAFFFINALYLYGEQFLDCIPYARADLVQGTYHFKPVNSGGFFNHGLSVISYTSDFEIVRKDVWSK